MKYRNTKTGVEFTSDLNISGGDWIRIDESNPPEETKETKQPVETHVDPKETDEEEIDLAELTNKQLDELAKKEGIKLTTEDKKNKDTRIAAIVKAFE